MYRVVYQLLDSVEMEAIAINFSFIVNDAVECIVIVDMIDNQKSSDALFWPVVKICVQVGFIFRN